MALAKVATQPTRTCSEFIRQGVEMILCKSQLERGKCPQITKHILPFPTGWCNSGWHEGDIVAKPTCKYFETCCCKCHQDLWFMFSLADRDRILVDNSTWHAHLDLWMPSKEERIARVAASFISTDSDVTPELKILSPGLPPVLERAWEPTPTGRAARGELENWVLEITGSWLLDTATDQLCVPKYIASQIARQYGLGREPSVGAIDAVLKRWVKIGFAETAQQPARFTGYTEVGIKFGLDFLKAKARIDGSGT